MESGNFNFLDCMSPKKRCRRSRKIEQEWSPNDVRLLIHLVKQREMLWNSNKPSHKDGKLREHEFKIIASTLGRSVADCKTKWDNLRAQYRSYQAKVTQNIEVKWQYFETLSFLNEVCEPRKSKTFSTSLETDVNKSEVTGKHFIEGIDNCSSLFSSSTCPAKVSEVNEQNYNSNSAKIFGDFVADQMRQLQPHIATELRRNILKLVLEALEK